MKPRIWLSLASVFVLSAFGFDVQSTPAQTTTPKTTPSEPTINIKLGQASDPLQEDPAKKVKITVTGATAQLVEFATAKPIGRELSTSADKFLAHLSFKITCWAFSPNGKYVAVGSGFKESTRFELEVNYGKVCVWDTSSGKLMASRGGKDGTIKAVAFSEDGKTVNVEAEKFFVNGK